MYKDMHKYLGRHHSFANLLCFSYTVEFFLCHFLSLLGDAPPIEADLKFESTQAALEEMLTRQMGVYEKEEHALRVHMKEEVRDKMQKKKGGATTKGKKGVGLNIYGVCFF